MGRFGVVMLAGACIAAAGLAPPSAADVVHLDVGGVFNADVVVNDGSGMLDPSQDPIDLGLASNDNFCFPTQSVARRLGVGLTPDGLPDDAFFPATASRPDVQLWWSNGDDGLNARRIAAATDAFMLDAPPGRYLEAHLFATSGDGPSDVLVTLLYDDGTRTATAFVVPDWFDDPVFPPGVSYLIDGRDRLQPGSGPGIAFAYEDRDDAAVFGLRVAADPTRTLEQVGVERTDATGVLDFFGATLVTVPRGPDLYESTVAPGLLAPAHVVARGVSAPHAHAPAMGARLFYFVDDGSGSPALIRVRKGPGGIVLDF